MLTALSLCLALVQDPEKEPPVLSVGETIGGEIADGDPQVHTPTLDRRYADAPVAGETYLLEVEEPGPYTIELSSYLFDAYLVLRDEEGKILAEDDDGAVGIHARITAELESPALYFVDACALHGERGAFELGLRKGRLPALSAGQERAAERADLERTVAVREKVLGPEHPGTATSLGSLALLLWDQGDYVAARLLQERALAIREKVLGSEHPDTASSLSNLARLFQEQGDFDAARSCYERALAIAEKVLGAEHRNTAAYLNNLAGLLWAEDDPGAARPYFERALAIREKVLGPEHPDTATSLNILAFLLQGLGDYAAARPLYERALAINERVRGHEHPDTAGTLDRLALLLADASQAGAAWDFVARSWSASRSHQRRLLVSLIEAESYAYLATVRRRLESLLSLAPLAHSSALSAYEPVLAWKGQVARQLLASRERLLSSLTEEERGLVDELRSTQARL